MIGQTLGDLTLTEEIGSGGYGVVYKAEHATVGNVCAVKVLRSDLAEIANERRWFKREVKAMARLTRDGAHPNIISIMSVSLDDSSLPYFVMEYMPGSLADKLADIDEGTVHGSQLGRPKIAPLDHVIDWTRQVCDGLAYAHECGVIHRDIKPKNLLLGPGDVVKLCDFGLAKTYGVTTTGLRAKGTTAYASPEQQKDPRTADHRADIYSLGQTLYQLLTGLIPVGREWTPPSAHNSVVPTALDRVVERATDPKPSQRFQTVSELREAIEEAVRPRTEPPAKPPREEDSSLVAQLVRDASPGDRVLVPSGVQELNHTLLIDKPLTLRGSDASAQLVSAAAGATVQFLGSHSWEVEDLTIQHTGTEEADVVVALGGSLRIVRCRVTGGVTGGYKRGGSGISIGGSARAEIADCESMKNQGCGIRVDGGAHVDVRGSRIDQNAGDGLVYRGAATGEAKDNALKGNRTGIKVEGGASPSIVQNRCVDGEAGIEFTREAGGQCLGNTCGHNGKGISIGGSASPRVTTNTLERNVDGLRVAEKSSPTLEDNQCASNDRYGMYVTAHATPTAHGNRCKSNGSAGIEVDRQAGPHLEGNDCEENRGPGISLTDTSRGVVVGNTCEGNTGDGIAILDDASPTVERNVCRNNTRYGLYVGTGSRADVRRNRLTKNAAGKTNA